MFTFTASIDGQKSSGESDLFLTARFQGVTQTNWTRQWGSAQFDYAHGVVRDGAGNTFAAGDANGKVGDKHFGGADAIVSKWNADHTLAFTAQWGTIGSEVPQAIAMDPGGNLWVVGYTDGDLDGTGAGGLDIFVTKLSAAGVLLWSAQWGDSADDAAFGIAIDSAGFGYVTGALASSTDRNIFCRKLSPDGKEAWTAKWGSPADDVGMDLALRQDGDVWVVGWTEGNLGGTGQGGAFLSKLGGQLGNVLSNEQLGATAQDSAVSISLLPNGDLYLSGITLGSMVTDAYAGDEDAFVQRRDSAGALLWT